MRVVIKDGARKVANRTYEGDVIAVNVVIRRGDKYKLVKNLAEDTTIEDIYAITTLLVEDAKTLAPFARGWETIRALEEAIDDE